jgi:hypothetical protein
MRSAFTDGESDNRHATGKRNNGNRIRSNKLEAPAGRLRGSSVAAKTGEEIAAMMESLSARCIRVTGLVFGLAAAAIAGGCMEARMLSSDEPYGIVTTFTSDIPDKVYPAYIAVIDGRNVQSTSSVGGLSGRKHTFRLAPGDHTIRVVADLSQATGTLNTGVVYTPRGEQPGEMKLFVEEGRRYYIGARLTGTRRDEWEPVIWAVHDIENYEHTIVQ